ncbi:unnamed protein product [Bemisia tabaci]|uniref:Uncharacterized protein n=1 Tax=Bemisia tabaci TaxID=7038 RepID=A0A9P0AHE7_BEMTA|nr:unnamed protein product [Bemisia tabaci]
MPFAICRRLLTACDTDSLIPEHTECFPNGSGQKRSELADSTGVLTVRSSEFEKRSFGTESFKTLSQIVQNMTLFWLHGEELMFGTSVHTVQQRIPQMKMMKVHIPFTFKLQYASKSSYADNVDLVAIKVPLWGAYGQLENLEDRFDLVM